jgi:hypothetical protein
MPKLSQDGIEIILNSIKWMKIDNYKPCKRILVYDKPKNLLKVKKL